MTAHELLRQAEDIRPGDHIVALYVEEREIEDYVVTYIHSALKRNERCIYITGDTDTTQVINRINTLRFSDGLKGDLVILNRSDTYAKDGKFDPDKLIELIKVFIEDALVDGYTGLAITGEISWVLNFSDGEALIVEYEWKLNEHIFNQYPASALCRYNVAMFSDEMIQNIIQLHPVIIWHNQIHENPYYVPPEGFKNNTLAKCRVEVWLENISYFTNEKSRFKSILEMKQEELHKLNKTLTEGIIMGFLKLLEIHDPYTKDHCTSVASLALKLAQSLDTTDEFKAKLYYAAIVHDIGKTIIPKAILNKPAKLSKEEYESIKMHPVFGERALGEVNSIQEIALAVKHHHEFFDGRGYPSGLSGTDIPLMSRIIAICDAYDAITNERPYREVRSHEVAIQEIVLCSNKQFDGFLVEHFVKLFQE